MYARSNELEEKGVINLNAVNVESNPDMEMLLGVSRRFWNRFGGVNFFANRKSSRSRSSPPPTRTLLLRLALRSSNRGLASSIPRVYWPSVYPSISTHPHACACRFFPPLLEGGHVAAHSLPAIISFTIFLLTYFLY